MTTLRLDGITRVYPGAGEVVALDDVSLTIRPGEFVAIVGPSGSGKSTLLNILGLLDTPSSGSYALGDQEVDDLRERRRAGLRGTTFGFVFQRFHLQEHQTAIANVELGMLYQGVARHERQRRATTALARVGLDHRATQRARDLSGGERQRVAIARAIVGGASVLLADEPTGSLDRATGAGIIDVLRTLAEVGTTVVLVTHDTEAAAAAHRRIGLRDGSIVTDSTAAPQRQSPLALAFDAGRQQRVRHRDIVIEAGRSLASKPRRAGGIGVSVAIAAGLVVALVGLTQTASAQVSERFDARRNREIVAEAVVEPETQTGMRAIDASNAMDLESRARRVAGVTGVAAVVAADAQPTSASPRRPTLSIPLTGTTPSLIGTIGGGVRWAPGHSSELGPREALVGDIAAIQLDLAPLASDPFIFVNGQAFAAVGVLDDVERAADLRSSVMVSWDDAASAGRPTRINMLVETEQGAAQQAASQIAVALDPVVPDRFTIDAPSDPRTLRGEIESDVSTTMLLLTALTFAAALAVTALAMTAGVAERTGEIGLRRAMGARGSHILEQVGCEACIMGLLGGVAGLVLGLIAVLATTIAKQWQPTLDLRTIPLAVGSGVVAAMLGGVVAARRAARVQPIAALRS